MEISFLEILDVANPKQKGESNNPHRESKPRKRAMVELENMSLLTSDKKKEWKTL